MTALAVTLAHAIEKERRAEVWKQLGTVVDPELDESVTDMNFISRVDVDNDGGVQVDFRLPTYWCAANFAFMMASDMRTALLSLPWVKTAEIVLGEHMYAEVINKGLAEGLSFEATFGKEADGNLDDVRRTFLVKAFQRRQEALINYLLGTGTPPGCIVTMTIAALQSLPLDEQGLALTARYLDRRNAAGQYLPMSNAFVTAEGQQLDESGLKTYLSGLRRIRANAEFNGALCRGLLSVRFDLDTPLPPRAPKKCGPQLLAPKE